MTRSEKNPPSRWKKGQSGNPAGKPPGTKHKATRMVLELMEDGAKEITQRVIEAAKDGDMTAARLIIERLAPPVRERPVSISFPDMSTAEGIGAAQQAILDAVGAGDLMPTEASTLANIVEGRRKALETTILEQRIAALEAKEK